MPAETLVRDVMTKNVVTVRPEQAFTEAADLMADKRVGALPVVDGANHLVGLLRDEDLIVSEARVHVPTFIQFLGATIPLPGSMHHYEEDLHKVAGSTVGEVMDDDPSTIGPEATLGDVATLMHESEVTHIPVVDVDRTLLGIIARGDLVKDVARTT
jgi:CBS domain-containing protein